MTMRSGWCLTGIHGDACTFGACDCWCHGRAASDISDSPGCSKCRVTHRKNVLDGKFAGRTWRCLTANERREYMTREE